MAIVELIDARSSVDWVTNQIILRLQTGIYTETENKKTLDINSKGFISSVYLLKELNYSFCRRERRARGKPIIQRIDSTWQTALPTQALASTPNT